MKNFNIKRANTFLIAAVFTIWWRIGLILYIYLYFLSDEIQFIMIPVVVIHVMQLTEKFRLF